MANRGWPILWNARWIWAAPKLRPVTAIASDSIPPRETWNRFCYVRKSIDLAEVPTSVPARVTADSAFEEYWNAQTGTGSRCHAWSATPTYDSTAHVLGVHPLRAGYAEAEIAPIFGALRHLEGVVPTPKGMIEIVLDRERGGEVTLPAGVDAVLRFDDAPLGGARLGAGRHRIVRA